MQPNAMYGLAVDSDGSEPKPSAAPFFKNRFEQGLSGPGVDVIAPETKMIVNRVPSGEIVRQGATTGSLREEYSLPRPMSAWLPPTAAPAI